MSRNKLESIRYVDLSQNKCLQYLVDREESQYLGSS